MSFNSAPIWLDAPRRESHQRQSCRLITSTAQLRQGAHNWPAIRLRFCARGSGAAIRRNDAVLVNPEHARVGRLERNLCHTP